MYWYQGIGSDFGPFFAYRHTCDACESTYSLDCFYDNNFTQNDCVYNDTTEIKTNKLLDTIMVYPNPTSDYIDVESAESNDLKQINIYDLTGKIIFNRSFVSKARIYLESKMGIGIYILKVKTRNGIRNFKIIKTN
jgi:hypothetical protein